jgi:hypothetical protein
MADLENTSTAVGISFQYVRCIDYDLHTSTSGLAFDSSEVYGW